MFFGKKQKVKELDNNIEGYEDAAAYAGGVGGFGHTLPKSKEGLVKGWWCPNCENIYSPKVKECKPCNKENKKLKSSQK